MPGLYVLAAAANAWVLLGVLAGAFVSQFAAGEPPCPLCVMQRIAMMLAMLGPCVVLVRARRGGLTAEEIGTGAGIAILASVLGAAVSLRQVSLHILPGDPGFGAPVMGMHLYTWAFVAFACNITAAGVQLAALPWFAPKAPSAVIAPRLATVTVAAVGVMLVANILSVIAEAGFAWHLPDNPTTYLLFK